MPTRRIFLNVVFAWALLALAGKTAHAEADVAWQNVAGGIDRVEFSASSAGGRPIPVHAFRIDLQRAQLHLVSAGAPGARLPVSTMAARFPEHVAINASFFDDKDRAIGAVIDGSNISARRFLKNWGALVVNEKNARIEIGSALQPDKLPSLPSLPSLAVQGIPRLIVNGEVLKLKPQIAARTAVCAQARYVILVITDPIETTALAELLRDRLHCRDALNLDGGPSSQLNVHLGKLRLNLIGQSVPNALVAIPEAPRPKSN